MRAYRRTVSWLVCFLMMLMLIPTAAFAAEEQPKIVRVAYCLSDGYQEGEEGTYKTGFGYEYLQALARINGWKYEYVYGSFDELLGKLKSGEIDLMGNLLYTEERAGFISYGRYEQGRKEEYLYANKMIGSIDPMDYSTFNGKRIGVHAGTIQADIWRKWCAGRGILCRTVEFENYDDCQAALNNGEIDAALGGALQQSEVTADWEIIVNFGAYPFYFGVSKSRPDLLKELNSAQKTLIDANPHYNEEIFSRHMKSVASLSMLDDAEKEWLETHPVIKVGYLRGFPPLCYMDENGVFKGVAADVLASVEKTYAQYGIRFEAHVYAEYTTMFSDLRDGKLSIAWPAYEDAWPAEQYGFIPTDCIVSTPMMLVYDGKYTLETEDKIGVINTGSLPKIYAQINYPKSEIHEYDSYVDAINAIVKKEVSCVLYVATTYNVDVESNKTLQRMNMSILPNSCEIAMGVALRDEPLVSILNKGIAVYGDAGINHSLIIHSAVKKKVSLKDYFEQHPYTGIGLCAIVLVVIGGIIIFVISKNMSMRIKTSQAEKEMYERISNSDPLTGLYNRKAVFAKSRALLKEHSHEKFAMAHVDMVHFRLFNTFFGDEEGDRLLCEIANLFRAMSKDYEYWAYGRIEADVFCAFFPYDEERYRRHMEGLQKYFSEYRKDFLIQPQIGMYFVTDSKMPIESMFTRASMAAKEVQPGTPLSTVVYDETLEKELNEKQQIINDMRTALAGEQFHVYLQPKYSLRTNKMVGAEALVRWFHPTKGVISPGVFIPVFESNGFITELDRYMWEHVCSLLAEWKEAGMPLKPVSVNVSRLSMYGTSTVDFLKGLIQKYGIDPKYLELELTETAFIEDPDEMKAQMLALKAAGFTILLDDFGSGYSSLNTLRELPVDVLKLDMKFLPLNEQDTRAGLVLSSVVRMSKLLKLTIIAEGVEQQEQAEYLRSIGCEYVQGYLFARPMSVEDYEKLLPESGETQLEFYQPTLERIGQIVSQNGEDTYAMRTLMPLPFACLEYTKGSFAFLRVNPFFYREFNLREDLQPASALFKEHLDAQSFAALIRAFEESVQTEKTVWVRLNWTESGGEAEKYLCQISYEGNFGESAVLLTVFMHEAD